MTVIPARYRHPLRDPDPALGPAYRVLFGGRVAPPASELVDALAAGLMRSDDLADDWLRAAAELGRAQASRMLEQASRHGVASVPDAPEALRRLFAQLERVPAWVDPQKLRLGAMAFRRAGILGHFVLSDFGLMGGYRSAAVAKTLMRTGKLAHGAMDRLIATGRFVVAATEPGDILPGHEGYAFTIRVRMVHAMVRASLLAQRDWKVEEWGIPINQSDTLGTNLLFSIGFLEGSRQWGIKFTDDEAEAVIHLWRYIGYLIGIDEGLLPANVESARSALYAVGVSQPPPDADSRALAKALYEVPLGFAGPGLSGRIIRKEVALRLAMTRHILGDEAVDQLGLPRTDMDPVRARIVGFISRFEAARQFVPGGSHLAYRVSDFIVKKGQEVLTKRMAEREGSGVPVPA